MCEDSGTCDLSLHGVLQTDLPTVVLVKNTAEELQQ